MVQQQGAKEDDEKDIERIRTHLPEHYENLSTSIENIETLNDEILRLNSNMIRMNNQPLLLEKDINDAEIENLTQKDHIEARIMNQTILTRDLTSIEQQIEYQTTETKQHILDGSMIWTISGVREKITAARLEQQTSLYSPPFYTSETGYKLCIRLYLNGDGTARGTDASIFLVVLRGRFDAILKWPFSYRVSFCLFDQRTMIDSNGTQQAKHMIQSFRPDQNSSSFQRPRSAMNIASGIPKFVPLVDLNQPEQINRYIINDTMFIKVLIDFLGVPKSILPFIFNLNSALPLQIQQKLVDEEIARRNEQHVS